MTRLACLCCCALALAGPPVRAASEAESSWWFNTGGEIDGVPGVASEYHGILDLGWRRGALSASIQTDTLDLRWSPMARQGRTWIGLRGAGFAANMWITPWTDGTPDDSRAMAVAYVGPDLGGQIFGPHGLYTGVEGFARHHVFLARFDGARTPAPALWVRADTVLGVWRDDGVQIRCHAGVDWDPLPYEETELSPHVFGHLAYRPPWRWAPALGGWAGWANRQDALTSTRLGGLTPYHVPLAGAAWAEFWVEDYAVGSVALSWRSSLDAWQRWRADLLVQVATVDDGTLGYGSRVIWSRGRWRSELAAGVAPTLPRGGDYRALTLFYQVGTRWGAGLISKS